MSNGLLVPDHRIWMPPQRGIRGRGGRPIFGDPRFDLQRFAQAPSAELVTLGIGKEITYGTAVTPTVFLIPSSEGYDGTNELLERPGARKRIGQTEQLTGMFTGKGSMQVEADPDTLGALLYLAMGAEMVTTDAGNPSALPVTTTLSAPVGIGWNWATPAAMTNVARSLKLVTVQPLVYRTIYVNAPKQRLYRMMCAEHGVEGKAGIAIPKGRERAHFWMRRRSPLT